jgi:hypothetical protein
MISAEKRSALAGLQLKVILTGWQPRESFKLKARLLMAERILITHHSSLITLS